MMNRSKTIRAETRRTRGLTPSPLAFSATSASPRDNDLECMFRGKT